MSKLDSQKPSKRIGIFSGSFDPIHKGHIAFALEAAKAAGLDKVYFAPETKPRRKPHVTHIAHRLAMLQLAVRSQPKLGVLELPGKYFLPKTTMAHLRKQFPEEELVLLLGSDLFEHLVEYPEQWPHVEYLLGKVELAVASRAGQSDEKVRAQLQKLPVQPLGFVVVHNHQPELSSGQVRTEMAAHKNSTAVPPSVQRYAQKHWLYHDIPAATRQKAGY